ncbi:MAG: inositol monophosphatase family protein [Candidatus Bipolaricaulota bacterium]|nr:inositol monophosphatase family protein [Candidatus Bipolaricaulota bacterium]
MDKEWALSVAITTARQVGEVIRRGEGKEKGEKCKSHRHDPVTVFDRRAEELIVKAIEEAFPGHGILSEEGTCKQGSSPYHWVIDPLDGTNNFLRGYPQYSVSLALLRGDEEEVACIYDPLRGELFTAIRGGGARLSGERIEVSLQDSLDGALIGVGLSSRPDRALKGIATLPKIIPHARAVRVAGSACLDLAYVAAGRLDAAWYLSLSPWDVAAGTLLIEEAGGRVSDLAGERLAAPEGGILATNGLIHPNMLAIANRE